jgi:hypothetical protein
VLANLPAKAGHPVLRELLVSCAEALSAGGRTAVVIVRPLESLVQETLSRNGISVECREQGKEHTVFLYRRSEIIGNRDAGRADADCSGEKWAPIAPYIRCGIAPELRGVSYRMSTVYGLPDFDSVGRVVSLAVEAIESAVAGGAVEGEILFWNPGQGHVPAYVSRKCGAKPSRYILAGRDKLALEASRRNLVENGVPREKVDTIHAAFLYELSPTRCKARTMICMGDENLSGKWHRSFLSDAAELLEAGGLLVFSARSTTAQRVIKRNAGFERLRSRRSHGATAVAFRRQAG